MDLDGHYNITKTAFEELKGKLSIFPISADLGAVVRDLQDLVPLPGGNSWVPQSAHESDEGQRHHFMRIDGQTQEKAYIAAMAWIYQNASEAARMYIGGFKEVLGQGACGGVLQSPAGDPMRNAINTGAMGSGVVKGQKTVPWALPMRQAEYANMLCGGDRPLGTAAHAVEDSFAPMHVQRDGGL